MSKIRRSLDGATEAQTCAIGTCALVPQVIGIITILIALYRHTPYDIRYTNYYAKQTQFAGRSNERKLS